MPTRFPEAPPLFHSIRPLLLSSTLPNHPHNDPNSPLDHLFSNALLVIGCLSSIVHLFLLYASFRHTPRQMPLYRFTVTNTNFWSLLVTLECCFVLRPIPQFPFFLARIDGPRWLVGSFELAQMHWLILLFLIANLLVAFGLCFLGLCLYLTQSRLLSRCRPRRAASWLAAIGIHLIVSIGSLFAHSRLYPADPRFIQRLLADHPEFAVEPSAIYLGFYPTGGPFLSAAAISASILVIVGFVGGFGIVVRALFPWRRSRHGGWRRAWVENTTSQSETKAKASNATERTQSTGDTAANSAEMAGSPSEGHTRADSGARQRIREDPASEERIEADPGLRANGNTNLGSEAVRNYAAANHSPNSASSAQIEADNPAESTTRATTAKPRLDSASEPNTTADSGSATQQPREPNIRVHPTAENPQIAQLNIPTADPQSEGAAEILLRVEEFPDEETELGIIDGDQSNGNESLRIGMSDQIIQNEFFGGENLRIGIDESEGTLFESTFQVDGDADPIASRIRSARRRRRSSAFRSETNSVDGRSASALTDYGLPNGIMTVIIAPTPSPCPTVDLSVANRSQTSSRMETPEADGLYRLPTPRLGRGRSAYGSRTRLRPLSASPASRRHRLHSALQIPVAGERPKSAMNTPPPNLSGMTSKVSPICAEPVKFAQNGEIGRKSIGFLRQKSEPFGRGDNGEAEPKSRPPVVITAQSRQIAEGQRRSRIQVFEMLTARCLIPMFLLFVPVIVLASLLIADASVPHWLYLTLSAMMVSHGMFNSVVTVCIFRPYRELLWRPIWRKLRGAADSPRSPSAFRFQQRQQGESPPKPMKPKKEAISTPNYR